MTYYLYKTFLSFLFAIFYFGFNIAYGSEIYPNKPITLIVPTAPGGPVDMAARIVSIELSKILGQRVVIINKPGASQKIGIETLLRSPKDGYTFAACSAASMTISPAIDKNIGYDPLKDFVMLANGIENNRVLVIHPSTPAKNLIELIAYAKANPGKLTYGSGGNGTTLHFSTASLLNLLGLNALHVPYKSSGPALMGVLSGEVNLLMPDVGDVLKHINNGSLIALGISGATRNDKLPSLPTMKESGVQELKNWTYSSWIGFVAAEGTPLYVTDKLQNALQSALKNPKTKDAFEAVGFTVLASSGEQFQARVREEYELNLKLLSSGRFLK
jgi:tripartite-type tricarboxylate transporter receptor subunit TctC